MDHRVPVKTETIHEAMKQIMDNLNVRLVQHGAGSFISAHEIVGAHEEEFDEFREAVHDNDPEAMKKELSDMAVGCLFGLASLLENERAQRPKTELTAGKMTAGKRYRLIRDERIVELGGGGVPASGFVVVHPPGAWDIHSCFAIPDDERVEEVK